MAQLHICMGFLGFFEGAPALVSVNIQMFLQSLNMDISGGNTYAVPKAARLDLNFQFGPFPIVRAILRSAESSDSLTCGLTEQRQVFTGMPLADLSPDLGFLSCAMGAVISVSCLLFVCVQSLYVIYLKMFSDHFHVNDS